MKKVTVLFFIVGLFLVNLQANAQDVFTFNTASGSWNVAGNWTIVRDGNNAGTSTWPGETAGSIDGADSVIVPDGSTVTVNVSLNTGTANNDIGALVVGGGTSGVV